jgi:hypothetical protein
MNKPDRDYSCASSYCDDPACNLHGAKNRDGELLYWANTQIEAFDKNEGLNPSNMPRYF